MKTLKETKTTTATSNLTPVTGTTKATVKPTTKPKAAAKPKETPAAIERGYNEFGHLLNKQSAFIDSVVKRATPTKPMKISSVLEKVNALCDKAQLPHTSAARIKGHIQVLHVDSKRKSATTPVNGYYIAASSGKVIEGKVHIVKL